MEQVTENLIRDLQHHQPAACQWLLKTYGPVVYRMIQRIVTCREDVEEVYQDVFVKALRGIEGFNSSHSSLATWLKSIAYHESLNFVRGKRPSIISMDDSCLGIDTMDEPDDALQNEQTIQQLEQALDRLPPYEQAVVSMFYYDNMSLADIAFVTGSNTSTIGSQLSRIRKKLYRMIKTS
jgi:RNA polymerase sigma-70 factor (ECF subfamily)